MDCLRPATPCRVCSRVQAAIKEGQQPGAGSVRQALCGALYEQVTDFYRLVAVLESQLAVPIPAPGEPAVGADQLATGTAAAIAEYCAGQDARLSTAYGIQHSGRNRVQLSRPETAWTGP